MSDLFLMLAQTPAGLSCFAVPRWRPDGTRNAIRIERLKDKLGNRSNASSEIELDAAWGTLLGEEGAGVATIIRMVNHTRLDCVIGVTGQMRAGLTQAIHHTRHRSAFGKLLVDQPLMRQVLADLAVESEAATLTMLRLAAAYDAGDDVFSRLATAVGKYWCCKRTPMFAAEALECFGGNGYVETGPMARLFRESPLNGIWEGSGNVIALDVLRAITREPDSLTALLTEIETATGADSRFDRFVADLHAELAQLGDGDPQAKARRLTERLALALQGSLLLRYSIAAGRRCVLRFAPGRSRRADVRRPARRRRRHSRSSSGPGPSRRRSGPHGRLPLAPAHQVAVDVDGGGAAEEVRRHPAVTNSGFGDVHDEPRIFGGRPSCRNEAASLGEDVISS